MRFLEQRPTDLPIGLKSSIAFLVSLLLLVSIIGVNYGSAQGLTAITWIGGDPGGSANWHNPNNWSPVGVPTSFDDVTITCSASLPILTAKLYLQLDVGKAWR